MLYFWSENSSKSCDKKVTKYDSFDSSSRVECFCTSSGTNIWYKRQNSEKSKAAPIVFSVFRQLHNTNSSLKATKPEKYCLICARAFEQFVLFICQTA